LEEGILIDRIGYVCGYFFRISADNGNILKYEFRIWISGYKVSNCIISIGLIFGFKSIDVKLEYFLELCLVPVDIYPVKDYLNIETLIIIVVYFIFKVII
jgi:hypothetical protein